MASAFIHRNRRRMLGLVLALVMAGGLWGVASGKGKDSTAATIARGKYLVTIGSCNDCHTPWTFDKEFQMPHPDMSRMLSGHPAGAPDPSSKIEGKDMAVIGPTFTAFRLPFGVTYAANLTPDDQTGLGKWTRGMFIKALRTGKHLGGNGRAILPPMPWPFISQMTDDDLSAVFAYLRSIPAIKNEVPPHKVPNEVIDAISVNTQRFMEAQHRKTAAAR